MFQFANPHILWLLLTIPVMVFVLMATAYIRKRNIAKFGNPTIIKSLMANILRRTCQRHSSEKERKHYFLHILGVNSYISTIGKNTNFAPYR